MEHLTDSDVQVVLSLREGKGFDRISNPTCIVATLNGQSLETGCIESDSQPDYATDLVWKADKNVLRRMRSGQEPLKIECFEMKEKDRKDKIGHIILSLRSAKIVPPRHGDVGDVESPQWHKLLNLRSSMKADKPEVSLALTIEEHDAYVRRKSRQELRGCNDDGIPSNYSISPYLVEEESLIQLGPVASCQSLFLLNIIAVTAHNLHLLSGETDKAVGNYSLWYRILENDVQLKSFASLEKKWTLNEKIVIRIRSSPTVLRNYLQDRPNFLLILQYKDMILGHSEIDLGPLISGTVLNEDSPRNGENIIINQRCILNKENLQSGLIIGDNADNEAFLDLQLQLINVSSKKFNDERIANLTEIYQTPTRLQHNVSPNVDAHENPCIDFDNFIESKDHTVQTGLLNSENVRNVGHRVAFPRSINTATNSSNVPIFSKTTKAHHCYCLNVNLMAIKLSSMMHTLEFRFHHPKAKETTRTFSSKMPVSSNDKLRLQGIGCELNFIAANEEIRHLLLSQPPKVSVSGVTEEIATTAHMGQTILDTSLLFNHDKQHETLYEAPLYDNEKKEIGRIDVAMYLEDRGPTYHEARDKSRVPDENLGPAIIDDRLAYKIIEELEIWKERQQEIFQAELKKKEERHLNRLSEEWQKQRENLESKLACSVQQCKMLANSLNKATEDLRTRRLKSLEKEARLIKANEDLQWRYDNNIQQLQEASRQMHEDLSTKIKLLQEHVNNAEAQIEPVRVENEKLWRLTNKQAEEIEIYQRGSLTRDQTASLLQDVKALEQKLLTTHKSKSFFKEQWGKAVREIHRMKMDNQQAIQSQIKTSKDELKNIDLEEILCTDSSALTNDQIMLDSIQREIEVIKPRSAVPSHRDNTSNRSFFVPPIDPAMLHGCCAMTAKSDEQDERLRKLIEERDALLKTGSYTIDDTIIVKLNAEIRSLLISN